MCYKLLQTDTHGVLVVRRHNNIFLRGSIAIEHFSMSFQPLAPQKFDLSLDPMKLLLLLPSNLIQQEPPRNPGERHPLPQAGGSRNFSKNLDRPFTSKGASLFFGSRKRWEVGGILYPPIGRFFYHLYTTYIPLIVLAFSGCCVCYLPPFMGTRNNH